MQWKAAVIFKVINGCTLDINISINNRSLLRLLESQTLHKIFGQHSK